MPTEYDFIKLTSEKLGQLVDCWNVDIQDNVQEEFVDIAEGSYDRLFSWIKKCIGTENPYDHGFFVLQRASDSHSLVVVDMADATRAKDPAFKLLNIYFSPSLNIEYKEDYSKEEILKITEVLGAALGKATSHAFVNNSKCKMYCRTPEVAKLFDTMLTLSGPESFSVTAHARWLEIEPAN